MTPATPLEETAFISLQNLEKSYPTGGSKLPVFSGLDLTIPKGDFAAIMGPSGSGKSTLLNLLAGIDHPDRGEIRIGRTRLDQMGEAARTSWRAHHLGIVFQFYNLLPMLTVAENVELPLLLKPLSARMRRERVMMVLELVGLTGHARHRPSQLSGGQQQRTGIGRAIVSDPELILCDEPTGDLDRKSADDILAMLRVLNEELGKTILMVTHDPLASVSARRTLHLDKGTFLEERRAA